MAYVSDLTTTPLSGLNHIDALLDKGPDWNYLTNANNTIRYTFATDSGNESGQSGVSSFSASQQANARTAMAMLATLTGITFVETSTGTAAQIHFANTNISGANTSGLASWSTNYSYNADQSLVDYKVAAYVYLDNVEFAGQNGNLSPGGRGYETLLHEIGHALGLKHPFEDAITLPASQDNTSFTLLSYTSSGGPHSSYSPYDVAALNWLYGGDGLGGALGIGSTTGARYITGTAGVDTLTGTSAGDVLRGNGGNDTLNGGGGDDTAIFSGLFSAYSFSELAGGRLGVTGQDGVDILDSIENLRFDNMTVRRADLGGTAGGDVTPPAAPTLSVSKTAAGYIVGSTPSFSGTAEASATVKIYNGNTLLASTVANASGQFAINGSFLADGSYQLRSTATDAAGNVSGLSAPASFFVDVNAPVAPTAAVGASGGVVSVNQPGIFGTGEAGTQISVVGLHDGVRAVIAETTVASGGTWSATPLPLADGAWSLNVRSTDGAGNSVERAAAASFTVASTLNSNGGATSDSFSGRAGNNAFDGKGGIDTVLYANARSSYTVLKTESGFTVNAGAGSSDGIDSLVNVERLKFANGAVALDIDGNGGQSYRVYKAAFDRVPDSAGVGYWIKQMDDGQSLRQVADNFIKSAEFAQLYGSNVDNTAFVSKLYQNVLHRGSDGAGFDYWVNVLNTNSTTRADVLANFSESSENQVQVIGQIQNGFDYTPWA